jgi:hypothetical protein
LAQPRYEFDLRKLREGVEQGWLIPPPEKPLPPEKPPAGANTGTPTPPPATPS